MLRSNDTKYLFFDFVRRGWDLLADEQLEIEYDDSETSEYRWNLTPVRGHIEVFSWEETMLWIAMKIQHRVLAKELWVGMSKEWKIENILNV